MCSSVLYADDGSWSPTKRTSGTQSLDGSQYEPHQNSLTNSWSGKLATASDPYFQNPPGTPLATPQSTKISPTVSEQPPLDTPIPAESTTPNESIESTPPTDTAPNTPASITTSTALEIEEYLDLLEAEEEEEDRYNLDPNRLQRDREINERVNKSLAEAETAALAREILLGKLERKTVQFAASSIPTPDEEVEGDLGRGDVVTTTVYVWDTFRDFATARSVTGFEEFVPEPMNLKAIKRGTNSIRRSAATGTGMAKHLIVHGRAINFEDVGRRETDGDANSKGRGTKAGYEDTKTEICEENIAVPTAAKVEKSSKVVVPTANVGLQTKDSTLLGPLPLAVPTPPAPVKFVATPPATSLSLQLWRPVPPSKLPESQKSFPPTAVVVELPKVIPALPQTHRPVVGEPPKPGPAPATVKLITIPTNQAKIPLYLNADYPKPRKDLAAPKVFKNVEPANTWDMPNIPLVKVSMSRCGGEDVGTDKFLEGLSASKKVKEKPASKKVVMIEEPKPKSFEIDSARVCVQPSPPPIATVVAPIAFEIPGPAPAKSPEAVSAVVSLPKIPGSQTFAAIATPTPKAPTFSSHPPTSSALRSGMPVPVPVPPTPRPAIKSPTKVSVNPFALPINPIVLTIGPKPANLVRTPKANATISPIVGGLVDPFLASLQPTTKKEPSTPVRPKTPSSSSESADSTPQRNDSLSTTAQRGLTIETPINVSWEESAPTSPTSLSSSWTLVEKARKDMGTKDISPPGPPTSTPVQGVLPKEWYNSADTKVLPLPSPRPRAPTPVPTPIIAPTKPATDSASKSTVLPNGRKLFTFELKVGQSVVSTPVHELDNPRAVAESFAEEHNLESRLPGGKVMVEKIIGYFETQFADRKAEREKRRAERRERTSTLCGADQQKL